MIEAKEVAPFVMMLAVVIVLTYAFGTDGDGYIKTQAKNSIGDYDITMGDNGSLLVQRVRREYPGARVFVEE